MGEPKYSFDQWRRALEAAVEQRGEDYVYLYPIPDDDQCLYFHEGQPSCGVGLAGFILAPEVFEALKTLDPGMSDQPPMGLQYLRDIGFADSRTVSLLGNFQAEQDAGEYWGSALRSAEDSDRERVIHTAWRENSDRDQN